MLCFVSTRHRPDGTGSNFNIGYSGGPSSETRANREALAQSLGIRPQSLALMNQVHGSNFREAEGGLMDMGFESKETAAKDTDILITRTRGICLVARSADCIPVILYSPDTHSAAAAHSGREGTYLGVAAKAASLLVEKYGARPDNIIACIGPGICAGCYEVGLDCAQKFINCPRFRPDTIRLNGSKAYLDLKKMIFYDLLTFGLIASNIEISDICTKCRSEDFFSARRGDSQRFCAGICLK